MSISRHSFSSNYLSPKKAKMIISERSANEIENDDSNKLLMSYVKLINAHVYMLYLSYFYYFILYVSRSIFIATKRNKIEKKKLKRKNKREKERKKTKVESRRS